jgi:DNA polymerase-3 subunit delta
MDATCRFVVLCGEEEFLRQLHTASLRAALTKALGEVDVVQFDGETARAGEILDECRSFGLIASHKMVVVDHADEVVKEENRALFERYAQGLIEAKGESGATLVLRSKTWRPGKLDKLIAEVGVVQKCEVVSDEKATSWAVARCRKAHAGELTMAAAELLVSRVGGSLGRIDSELGKLAAAAGSSANGVPNPISPQLVAEFVGMSREEEIWSIQGTLLSGDATRALTELAYAVDVSREAPAKIFFAFTDLARKLHAASHGVRQGMNGWQLKGPLKLWGNSLDTIMASATRLPTSETRRLLRLTLVNMTRDRTGLGDSVRTLEQTALEFVKITRRA